MDRDASPQDAPREKGEDVKTESPNSDSKSSHEIDCLKSLSGCDTNLEDLKDDDLKLHCKDSSKKIQGDTGELETSDDVPDAPVSKGESNNDEDQSSIIEKSAREAWLDEIGIRGNVAPKFPHYSEFKDRLKSFKLWTSQNQKPSVLSEAGFFYIGVQDRAACFHCGGGLREWKSTDDPWIEHAHWFPKCSFVLNVKGQEYINQAWRSKFITTPKEMKNAAEALKDLFDVIGPKLRNNLQKGKGKISSPRCTDSKTLQFEDNPLNCLLCCAKERNVVFLPCKHLVCCGTCASRVSRCVVCRRSISNTMCAIYA